MLTLNKTVPSKVQVSLSGDGDIFDEDTKKRIEEARKAGVPEPQIQMEATEYQARKNPIIKKTDTSKVADLLPLIGAVGGSFIPGLGTIVGGALGAGLGTAMKQEAKKQPFDIKEIGKETLYAGAGGAIGKGVGYVGGKVLGKLAPKAGAVAEETGLLPRIGKTVENIGTKTRSGVSKIYTKSSIYGAGEEKAIQNTLKELGIKGTSQTQYESLLPAMTKLEGGITNIISTSSKPVLVDNLGKTFMENLRGSVLLKDLSKQQAQQEIKGFLQQLSAMSGAPRGGTTVDAETLLKWKRLINENFGGISKKVQMGNPLTPTEQVANVAWKSIDDAISKNYPDVKNLLTKQSHLYKASQSLGSARKTVPTNRFMGTTIPKDIAEGGQDWIGRKLENVGAGMQNIKLPQIPGVNPESVAKVSGVLPSIGAGVGAVAGGLPQIDDSSQNDNNVIQGEDTQQSNNQSHENQYITGYSPEQLFQAVMTAQQAGDTKSATMLKGWYEAELKYQEGGSEKAVPATIKAKQDLSTAGLRARQDAEDIFKENPNIVLTGMLTGGLASRKFDSALSRAIEGLLRARSGAAVPDSEVAKYKKDYGPRIGDTRETALYKLKQLELDLMDVFNGQAIPDQLPIIQ